MAVQGKFDLFNAPAVTKELTIEDISVGTTLRVDVYNDGSCDFLNVLGEATLDGTLQLEFKNFTPIEGMSYRFLKAGSFSGEFSELEVLGIDPRIVDYEMAGGSFTIVAVPEPASLSLLGLGAVCILRCRCRKCN